MAVSAGDVIFSPTLARVRTFRGQEKLALVAAKVNCVVSLDGSSFDGSRRSTSWSLDAVSGRAIRSALALGGSYLLSHISHSTNMISQIAFDLDHFDPGLL